jgi:hypothetical protein
LRRSSENVYLIKLKASLRLKKDDPPAADAAAAPEEIKLIAGFNSKE